MPAESSAGLRVYRPDNPAAERWTLSDVFERVRLRQLEQSDAAPGTVAAYRAAVNRWVEFTGNPPVADVTDATVAAFFAAYRAAVQPTAATVNKQWRHLRAVFRAAARRAPGNPRGMTSDALLEHVPWCPAMAEPRRPRRLVDRELLGRLYRSAAAAAWPADAAALVWRTLWVLVATYGLRTRDALELPAAALTFSAACPEPEWRTVENPHGWLAFVPAKTARRKPEPLVLPLTAVARAHLQAVLRRGGDSGRVFALPRNSHYLHRTRRAICAAAGVDPVTFRDLRSAAAAAWNLLYPGLGAAVLGHRPRGVHERYYDQTLLRLVEHGARLPQPAEWLDGAAELRGPEQLRLF